MPRRRLIDVLFAVGVVIGLYLVLREGDTGSTDVDPRPGGEPAPATAQAPMLSGGAAVP